MDTKTSLQLLQDEVFAKQTVLADIFFAYRERSIFEYSNSWTAGEGGLDDAVAGVIRRLLARSYGEETAVEVVDQLRIHPLVSTTDHHGILNHPFFVNSNLIYSLKRDSKYLVVFPTAGISLNNSSWPGCLMVHEDGALKRFSIFPDREKTKTVLWTQAYGLGHIQTLKKTIDRQIEDMSTKEALLNVVTEVLIEPVVLGAEDFSAQSSMVSSLLWKRFFPNAPQLAAIPIEDVVNGILTEVISADSAHPLHQLMYTEKGWNLLEKHFDGWLGAFSHTHKGSFLFWGLGQKGRRIHLHRHGRSLLGEGMSLEIEPGAVKEMLEQRQMYPTSLLCFLVLLWYRLTCLGGFNQVNWLTDIKLKLVSLLEELSNSAAVAVSRVETKNFAESNLAFIPQGPGFIRATGMDLLVRKGTDWWDKFNELSRNITVEESLVSLLPEIYRVITPAPERRSNLLSVTDAQAADLAGISKKVRDILPG